MSQDPIQLQLVDDTASVLERGVVTVNVLANDVGEGLQIIGYSTASGATLTQDENHNLVYTADVQSFFNLTPGQTTKDTITYQVQDVYGNVATAHVRVTVGGAANAPDIYGGLRSKVLMGTDGDERIFAGLSGDVVWGGGGADTIYGGVGKDHLFGGEGPDLLIGGVGSDELSGGYGDDTLVGGLGPDRFIFEDFWGDDVVIGFNSKTDKIQLPQLYFASFKEVLNAAHDDGHGNLVISTPSHEGHIDTITLMNVSAKSLRASDFVFI